MNEETAIEFLVSVEPRWTDFTQYCIRGLMEHFSITESKAIKLYHKVMASGKVEKVALDVDDTTDKHDHWGGGFGRIKTTYWKIIRRDRQEVKSLAS